MTMTSKSGTTTTTAASFVTVGWIILCWATISSASSLSLNSYSRNHRLPINNDHEIVISHAHHHRGRRRRFSGRTLLAPIGTVSSSLSWCRPSRNHHCVLSTLHEEVERGERDDDVEESNADNNDASIYPYESILLMDTMMDIDDGVIYNDGDGVNDNDNSSVEQREHENDDAPSTLPSPSSLPPSASSSSSLSSSEISSNKLEGKNYGFVQTSIRSSNSGDKRVSSREQRPSNRRMQVFAYLSKPGE
jgi:hypothetical protein